MLSTYEIRMRRPTGMYEIPSIKCLDEFAPTLVSPVCHKRCSFTLNMAGTAVKELSHLDWWSDHRELLRADRADDYETKTLPRNDRVAASKDKNSANET